MRAQKMLWMHLKSTNVALEIKNKSSYECIILQLLQMDAWLKWREDLTSQASPWDYSHYHVY